MTPVHSEGDATPLPEAEITNDDKKHLPVTTLPPSGAPELVLVPPEGVIKPEPNQNTEHLPGCIHFDIVKEEAPRSPSLAEEPDQPVKELTPEPNNTEQEIAPVSTLESTEQQSGITASESAPKSDVQLIEELPLVQNVQEPVSVPLPLEQQDVPVSESSEKEPEVSVSVPEEIDQEISNTISETDHEEQQQKQWQEKEQHQQQLQLQEQEQQKQQQQEQQQQQQQQTEYTPEPPAQIEVSTDFGMGDSQEDSAFQSRSVVDEIATEPTRQPVALTVEDNVEYEEPTEMVQSEESAPLSPVNQEPDTRVFISCCSCCDLDSFSDFVPTKE